MQIIDDSTKTRGFQVMVAMRDGTRLNTFVFLPGGGGPRWPVILHRTPYGITAANAPDKTDVTKGWLPSPEEPLLGSILRGWRNIVAHGYAAVIRSSGRRACSVRRAAATGMLLAGSTRAATAGHWRDNADGSRVIVSRLG